MSRFLIIVFVAVSTFAADKPVSQQYRSRRCGGGIARRLPFYRCCRKNLDLPKDAVRLRESS